MLASTVQFSSNDQPPTTRQSEDHRALGPAPKTRPSRPRPQDPTTCPTDPRNQTCVPHTPRGAVLTVPVPGPAE
jgi:hypothetical protein